MKRAANDSGTKDDDKEATTKEIGARETTTDEIVAKETTTAENGAKETTTVENGAEETTTEENADGGSNRLPKVLKDKFKPLKCELCNIEMNSTIQGDAHYQGKTHSKNVTAFLEQFNEEGGLPPTKKIKLQEEADLDSINCKYCDLCNIVLTSKSVAIAHYLGKKHKKLKEKQDPSETESPALPATLSYDTLQLNKFQCAVCNVNCLSEKQLQQHYDGAKHKKKLKQQEIEAKADTPL